MTEAVYPKHFRFFEDSQFARKYKYYLHANKSQLLVLIGEHHLHGRKGSAYSKTLSILVHCTVEKTFPKKPEN